MVDEIAIPGLRDAGKKAIDRMKEQRQAARAELAEWVAVASEFGARTPADLRRLLAVQAR